MYNHFNSEISGEAVSYKEDVLVCIAASVLVVVALVIWCAVSAPTA